MREKQFEAVLSRELRDVGEGEVSVIGKYLPSLIMHLGVLFGVDWLSVFSIIWFEITDWTT